MTATSDQPPTSLRHKILAVFFSLVIGGVGASALPLGLTHDWPVPFAVLTAALLVSTAVWNVATLDRTSAYPKGAKLLSLAALCLATGLTGLLSSKWVASPTGSSAALGRPAWWQPSFAGPPINGTHSPPF